YLGRHVRHYLCPWPSSRRCVHGPTQLEMVFLHQPSSRRCRCHFAFRLNETTQADEPSRNVQVGAHCASGSPGNRTPIGVNVVRAPRSPKRRYYISLGQFTSHWLVRRIPCNILSLCSRPMVHGRTCLIPFPHPKRTKRG